MIVKIQVRDYDGHFIYRDAHVGEFAEVSMKQIIEDGREGREDGWWWLRQWLCKILIRRAEDNHGDPKTADRWYARYQAIRGIE